MRKRTLSWLAFAALLVALLSITSRPALAQDAPPEEPQDQGQDPPSRVARLAFTQGAVSFNPAGTDDWVDAVLNRPMTTGDKLWTDQNSRAELHIGSAAIRLSSMTGFSFLNLDDRMMQIRLTEGTASIRVRRLQPEEAIEVDTPNLAFSLLRPGVYRVNVSEDGNTTVVTVRDGEGEVTGGGTAYTVHPGEEGYFTGSDVLDANIQPAAAEDEFDQWSEERDLREDHSVSRRYVSEDVIGYQDLDDNGGWRPVPEYGSVWFPHVSVVGWAPYRYGHWAYIAPWGWTWVDDARWGFAPFHYGRWVFVGNAWGWVPCPPPVVAVAYVRPVYAPALVAWVGGPRFAVGVGVGGVAAGVNVGWFPLGPREVFVPSYRVSRVYVTNVNISNTTVNTTVVNNYYNTTVINRTVVNTTYVNQRVAGGVTAVSSETFVSARPVGRNVVVVNQREIVAAPVHYGAPAFAPPKQAVLGSGAQTRFQPPVALAARPVVAKTQPPPPPVPFARQQAAIQANQGRPLSIAQSRALEPQVAHNNIMPVRMAPPATHTMAPVTPRPQTQTTFNRPPANNNNVGAVNNPNANGAAHNYNNRPPNARPPLNNNPQLEEKHVNQNQQLQQKQDTQYQKLQQQQNLQQQKLQQQNANEQKMQQVQQQQQQKLQQLEQKHDQETKSLHDKQVNEHEHTNVKAPNPKQPEPKDKPHK